MKMRIAVSLSNYSKFMRLALIAAMLLTVGFVTTDLLLPSSSARIFQYDKQGNLIRFIKRDGTAAKYTLNEAGLVTRISHGKIGSLSGWQYPSFDSVAFDFDPAGNLISTRDSSGEMKFTWDEFSRPSEVISPDGKKIRYEYSPWNEINKITLPSGQAINYKHDLLANITEVEIGGAAVKYERADSQMIRRLPNGVTSAFTYAPTGLVASIQHLKADQSLISAYKYERDAANRIVLIQETTPQGQAETHYEYDKLDRLTKSTSPQGSISFEYDAMGNRIAQIDTDGKKTVYQYNADRRLIKAGAITFSYDREGNLIAKDDGTQRTTYKWDTENRLTEVSGKDLVRFGYDTLGNRVWKSVNGKMTRYLSTVFADIPEVLTESSDSDETQYLLGESRIAQRKANVEMYFLEDYLGSTRCVVGADGNVLTRYQYTPFGLPTLTEGSPQTDFTFAGEQFDRETGLFCLRARYMDPTIGRFISEDPMDGELADPMTFNRYAYANNNPVHEIDPMGMRSFAVDGKAAMPSTPQQPSTVNKRNGTAPVTQAPPQPDTSAKKTYEATFLKGVQERLDQSAIDALVGLQNRKQPINPLGKAISQLTAPARYISAYTKLGSAVTGHTIIKYKLDKIETGVRKLSDPEYTNKHPYGKYGVGLKLGYDIVKAAPGLKVTSVTKTVGAFKNTILKASYAKSQPGFQVFEVAGKMVNGVEKLHPNQTKTYLPGVGNSKSLRLTADTAKKVYKLIDKTARLVNEVGPSNVAQATKQISKPISVLSKPIEKASQAVAEIASRSGFIQAAKQGAKEAIKSIGKLINPLSSSSDTSSNKFLPPPGGGGSAVSKRGGVYLDQTAKIIGELRTITGATYDKESGQIILIGDKNNKSLPPMKPEYLAEAIAAVFSESPQEPGMTIDPIVNNSNLMQVRFFGHTENTRIGEVMYLADKVMKELSVGRACGKPTERIQSSVLGYRSLTDIGFAEGVQNRGLLNRFWLVPEAVVARTSDNSQSIIFDPIKIRVKTETMKWAGPKLISAGGVKDPQAEAWAQHFTEHYDEFAREFPVYAQLKQVAMAVATAKFMKQQEIQVDWNFVRAFAGQPITTPETVSSARAEIVEKTTTSRGYSIRKLTSIGGVDMTPQIQAESSAEAAALQETVNKAWNIAQEQGQLSFSVNFNNKAYEAVALPLSGQPELAAYNTEATDLAGLSPVIDAAAGLPGLTRYYNSTHNEPTEFGRSWSLLMPRLEFESGTEKGRQFLTVAGDPNTQVLVQRFVLTNQFGLGEERFTKHFIDQEQKRIAFAPENEASNYRAIYPEQDGNYRLLFANGDVAMFGSDGKLQSSSSATAQAAYAYDDKGMLTTFRVATDMGEEQVRYAYDDKQHIKTLTVGATQIAYEYDVDRNNLTSVRVGDAAIGYRYGDKRLLTEIMVDGQSIVKNSYDVSGRLLGQNSAKQTVEATPDGKVITVNEDTNSVKQYYDKQNRLTGIESSDGSAYRKTFDGEGNLVGIEVTMPTGNKASLSLSANQRALQMRDFRGIETIYHYNENSQISEIVVNNRRVASFDYGNGVPEITYENGTKETLISDNGGQVVQYRRTASDGNVQTITYSFDQRGELEGISYAPLGEISLSNLADTVVREGVQGKVEVVAENKIVSRNPNGSETAFTFDTDGKLVSVRDAYGKLTSYFYSGQHLQKVELPDGKAVHYFFKQGRAGAVSLQVRE